MLGNFVLSPESWPVVWIEFALLRFPSQWQGREPCPSESGLPDLRVLVQIVKVQS